MDEKYLALVKKQTRWTKLTALFMCGIFIVALVSAVILVPRTTRVLNNAEKTLVEANEAVSDLSVTAKQLSRIDFEGLVADTQTLVDDSTTGIGEAIEKLESIDMEGLNKAISDLGSIVSPIAKLFGN